MLGSSAVMAHLPIAPSIVDDHGHVVLLKSSITITDYDVVFIHLREFCKQLALKRCVFNHAC